SIVDATADIETTAQKIFLSKTFDNATSCSNDNSVVIEEAVYDEMIEALQKQGGYLCNQAEKETLEAALWVDGKRNAKTVAKDPALIAEVADIQNRDAESASFFMVKETGVGEDYPFSGEKLAVVLTIYKAKDFDDAVNISKNILNYHGRGHSCGLHTSNESHI